MPFYIWSWLKFGAIAALLSTALYLIHDYKTLGVTVNEQKNTISRLENNVKQSNFLLDATRVSLKELEKECKSAADRFSSDDDIMKRIDGSADPLTDAANYDPNAKKATPPVPTKKGK